MSLFNKLMKEPPYFLACVQTKTILLILAYSFVFALIGYESNFILFSALGLLLMSPHTRVLIASFFIFTGAIIYLNAPNLILIIPIILFGIYFGSWMSILMHSASHEAIKNKWVNRIVGEFASIFMMLGFINFLYIHILHHNHSDNIDLDPHNNIPNVGFIDYTILSVNKIKSVYAKFLPNNVCKNRFELNKLVLCVFLNRLLKIHILLILFGENLFSLFIIPCVLSSQLLFAYINYYTHPGSKAGKESIENIDTKILDRLINRLFAGVLFHKTHHKYPRAFNPMKLYTEKEKKRLQA